MTDSKTPKHVFVVMLENRSFDNLLGLSGFQPSIKGNTNTFQNKKYSVASPAPTTMTTDPGHELPDVLEQLTNTPPKDLTPPLGPYPSQKFPEDFANGTGFATNYATNTDEGNTNPAFPDSAHIGDIMKSFDDTQVPILTQLANEFAVCTQWYSSIPGPTWPNRFFLHLGSSSNMDAGPTKSQIAAWSAYGSSGFPTKKTVFQALKEQSHSYRLYHDVSGSFMDYSSVFSDDASKGGGFTGGGWIPQCSVLPGLSIQSDFWELKEYFASDLAGDYPYQYTFIEPHYGNIYENTYQGGSSQHPMDDVYGGEALVKFVYETLRNSDKWDDSLLIVTYDEHGGFYDSVPPPKGTPPNDGSPGYGEKDTLNVFGFEFDQLGVRVPTVVISPYIQKGTIDKSTAYDHTSVLATLRSLFGISSLTDRDKNATDVLSLLTLNTPRTDCPKTLANPMSSNLKETPPRTQKEQELIDLQELPESGNMVGTMAILLKTHLELAPKNFIWRYFIRRKFRRLKTRGQLKAYTTKVVAKLEKYKKRNPRSNY